MRNSNTIGTQSHTTKLENMIRDLNTYFIKKDLRSDIAEWIETASREEFSSCFILTVVQRPGSHERRVLPQEYRNARTACSQSTRLLTEMIADCGARSFTTDIVGDRLFVTTDNRYKITLVLE